MLYIIVLEGNFEITVSLNTQAANLESSLFCKSVIQQRCKHQDYTASMTG
jgi:hypothetical protein